jgi:uncharacterized protein (DUF58 family)
MRSRRTNKRHGTTRSLSPTRAGWCFLAIVLGVGFAALNTGNNLLYLVFSGMLGFLVLSGLLSETALRGIWIERGPIGVLHAEQEARVFLRIHNDQRRYPAYALTIEDALDVERSTESIGRVFILRIGPSEHTDRSYAWRPAARGLHHFGPMRVSTRFPFGLFLKTRVIHAPLEALVYPALVQLPAGSHDLNGAAEGLGEIAPVTSAEDQRTGLRQWRPQDRPGRIHWRRSLRVGRPLVGEGEAGQQDAIECTLSLAPHSTSSAQERAIAQVASEIVQALDAGAQVALRTATRIVPPGSGLRHRRRLLELLATLDASATRAAERRPNAPLRPPRGSSAGVFR